MELNETKTRLNIPGLLMLFMALTVVGCLLSFVYILALDVLPSLILCVFAAVLVGMAFAKITQYCIRTFHIDNKAAAMITTLLALIIVNYFKWCCFFALNYLRYDFWDYGMDFTPVITPLAYFADFMYYILIEVLSPEYFLYSLESFNLYGTWGFDDGNSVTGLLLGVIWLGEFLIINCQPVAAVWSFELPFDSSKGRWAEQSFLNYRFEKFNKADYNQVKNLDIKPLLAKPASQDSDKGGFVALYHIDGENTGHVALYNISNKKGNMKKKKIGKTILLPKEMANDLETQLKARYEGNEI